MTTHSERFGIKDILGLHKAEGGARRLNIPTLKKQLSAAAIALLNLAGDFSSHRGEKVHRNPGYDPHDPDDRLY